MYAIIIGNDRRVGRPTTVPHWSGTDVPPARRRLCTRVTLLETSSTCGGNPFPFTVEKRHREGEEEERWREAQMRPDVYFDRQNSWTRPKVNRSAELVLISCRGTLGDVPAYRRFLSCCFNLYLFLVVFLPT